MKKIMKTISIITFLMLISKIIGFSRELILAYFYGTSNITDQFLIGISAAGLLIGWISTFAIVHTPIFTEIKVNQSEKNAEKYSNSLVFFLIIFGVIFCAILFMSSQQIIKITAVGFDSQQINRASLFFQYALIGVLVYSVNKIYISELNCKGKIVYTSFSDLVYSLALVLVILCSGLFNNSNLLLYAYPVAAFIQTLILMILLIKSNRSRKIELAINKEIKDTLGLVKVNILSSLMGEINGYVDKMFGSMLSIGSVTALSYGEMISFMAYNVIALPAGNYMYPKLSQSIYSKNSKEIVELMRIVFSVLIIVSIPISLFISFYSREIITVLFFRGKFTVESLNLTSNALVLYSLYILPMGLRMFYNLLFNAMKLPKYNLFSGVFSLFSNFLLNFIFYKYLGVAGVALATLLTVIFTVILCNYYYNKHFNKSSLISIKFLIQAIVISVVAIFISSFIGLNVNNLLLIELLVKGISFILIYLFIVIVVNKTVRTYIMDKVKGR